MAPHGRSYRERSHDLYTSVRRRPVYVLSALCLIVVVLGLRQAYAQDDRPATRPLPGPVTDAAWNFARDGRRLVMGSTACQGAFPGLFGEVDRMVEKRRRDKITREELDKVDRRNGYLRVMLFDQEVCGAVWECWLRS